MTCAGLEVKLFPATAYAKQWFPYQFGYNKFIEHYSDLTTFLPYASGFLSASRTTNCNAQGNYKFERVLDGDYVLHTIITWRVGRSYQGGTLVNYMTVSNGEDTEKMIVGQ